VAALLRALGYDEVVVRHGPADEGWDIDAQWTAKLPSGDLRRERWRVECKRHKRSPAPAVMRDHAMRMIKTPPPPDHILFVTTASLTRPTTIDIEQFAADERVGYSIWSGTKLQKLLFAHLDDPALWPIIGPYLELDLPPDLLTSACRHQVAVEIQQRVGRKFLPDLCRARPLENEIVAFLAADPARQQVIELAESLRHLQPSRGGDKEAWLARLAAIAAAESWSSAQPHIELLCELSRDRLTAITQAANAARLRRTCFLIRDRAGSGKTNLLCHLVDQDSAGRNLFLFFSCKLDLPSSRRLDEVVCNAIVTALNHLGWEGFLRDPIEIARALDLALRRADRQLVILLDGINENGDLRALDEAIAELLLRWNTLPVKFIVTCRDIFWSFFDGARWTPFLFGGKPHKLPAFDDYEIDAVLAAYLRAFAIRGRVMGEALEKCRHPLILRFFCEAHRGRDVRDLQDLRLKDLFAEYWSRKKEEIAEALGLGLEGGRRIELFLASLVDHLMHRHATQLQLKDLRAVTGYDDIDSDESIYRRLLDQDVILEELPGATAIDQSVLARRIGFVYDEFFDYMMALAHARAHRWDSKSAADVCLDFTSVLERSSDFEQLRGVAEYLVLLCEPRELHGLLCATLAHLGHHEILCNVLPKLQDHEVWIEEVLRTCILSSAKLAMSPQVKRATGSESPYSTLIEQLKKLSAVDADAVFSFLVGSENGSP
jgi:hypothetical protein